MTNPGTACRAALLALCLAAAAATAQTVPAHATDAALQNVLQLNTSGAVEVTQDLLSITLGVTRDGTDAQAVQAQARAVLEQALAEARKSAQPGQLDVRTGGFSVSPRLARDGRIQGWVATAEMILEGRDFARITQLAGRTAAMTVTSVNFGLSRQERARAESEAQALAVQRFRSKADELSKGFGFGAWSLREVNVQSSEQGGYPRPRVMAMEARAAGADMPVPVEAGKATVAVNVSGSVQMR
jgi:predicted secreted protein